MPVKKSFPAIFALIMLCCAAVLYYSLSLSGCAAWSLIVSSYNNSAWELYKPLGIVYIFFTIIELSVLRPSLAHYLGARVIGMYVLCASALAAGVLLGNVQEQFCGMKFLIVGIISVSAAQTVSYSINDSTIRVEVFAVPLLVSVLCMLFLLIGLTFYPPDWLIFEENVNIFAFLL